MDLVSSWGWGSIKYRSADLINSMEHFVVQHHIECCGIECIITFIEIADPYQENNMEP